MQVAAGWPGLRQFEAALRRDYRGPPEERNNSNNSNSNSCFVSPLALQHVLAQSGIWLPDAALKDFAMGLGTDANGQVDACEALQAFEDALLAAETSGFADVVAGEVSSFYPQAPFQEAESMLTGSHANQGGAQHNRASDYSQEDFLKKLATTTTLPGAEDAARAGEECITQALLLPGIRTQSPAALSRRFTAPLLIALQERLNDIHAPHAHGDANDINGLKQHSSGVSFLPLPLFAEALHDMGFDLSPSEVMALGLQFCNSSSGQETIAGAQINVQSFLSWLFSHLPGMQDMDQADEQAAGDAKSKKGPLEWWDREPILASQLAQCLDSFNRGHGKNSSSHLLNSGRYLAQDQAASFVMQLRTKLEQFDRHGAGCIGKWQLGACLEEVWL